VTPEFLTDPALGAAHGFFTRRGGVSTGPFASLNCSLSGADEREAVLENRARAATAIGAAPATLLGLTQVHGIEVATVTEPWLPGAGPRADAAVTSRPGLALGIVTADCAPVLFADREAGIVGAAHAGWRGAVAGVLEATIAAMRSLGARTIRAAIGPCIQRRSYEVGPDLRDAVLAHDPKDARFVSARFFSEGEREGHWQFDLPAYCLARLHAAGLDATALAADTMAEEDRFFSHRRRTRAGGGPIGHQISIIAL
jgi:polyphenol oxidase